MSTLSSDERLRPGALGVPGIVFMVLAFVTPIGVVAVSMPLAFLLGNGPGMPGVYVLAGLVLIGFSAGFTAMSRHVTNAGAFYAYIARGLGRPAGVAAASVAVLCYTANFISVAGAFGAEAHLIIDDEFGLDVPWQVWVLLACIAVGVLGRRKVDLNARVLGAALIVEVAIVTGIVMAILVQEGPRAFSVDVFSPGLVLGNGLGVSLVFAFNGYLGFEATAIFAEEAKTPTRTIPRATYLAIVLIAVFYSLTSWAFIAASGSKGITASVHDAPGGPGNFLFAVNDSYIGGLSNDVLSLLVLSSLLAALLAIHNATARYLFVLGREGLLPASIGRTHPSRRSPHVASLVHIVVSGAVLAVMAAVGMDPLSGIATSMAGLGVLGVVFLMAFTSVSVLVFFHRAREPRRVVTFWAPLVSSAALLVCGGLIVKNYDVLAGTTYTLLNRSDWLPVLAALLGGGYALRVRRRRPDVYARIGAVNVLELETPRSSNS